MKALTLMQPFASLVAERVKWIETRSWQWDCLGEEIAIHASAGITREYRDLAATLPFRWALRNHAGALPRGAVIAVARVAAIWPVEMQLRAEHPEFPFMAGSDADRALASQFLWGGFSPGRFLWVLKDVRRLVKPIPAKGALKLWELPNAIERELEEQLAAK